MAKKGQAIQLQTEVNNDEEWEKLLQRDGLIVIDVYSDWCGPCSGMTATLKKLKLEIGGEVLQLAVAKSDKITALERFRNKSEPTWMLVVNGKLVNFMFGANAPKLTRLITEELKKEEEARAGRRERVKNEIGELTDEEKERLEVIAHQQQEAQQKEVVKAAKELRERRTAECHNILETLQNLGVIIIFPHARSAYQEAFGDLFGEAALTISQTEKQVQVNETILEEILYFSDQNTEEYVVEDNVKKPSLGLLLKRSSDNLPGTIDDVINQMVYGNCRQPPGDENSPYQKLLVTKYDAQIPGVWAPANSMCKAMALKWFFPNVSGPFKLCEEKPVAPHVIMAYDAFKYREVMELLNIHPDAVMKYGFFSNDVPGEAQLLAKTVDQFEKKLTPPTYEEKIVVLLAKNRDWYDAFYDLGPSYSSSDAVEGEKEAVLFFPAGYDIPEDVVMETKKKPKKKAKSRITAVAAEAPEDETAQVDSESAVETVLETEDQLESELTEEKATEIDDEESEEAVQEIDKATSPMDAD